MILDEKTIIITENDNTRNQFEFLVWLFIFTYSHISWEMHESTSPSALSPLPTKSLDEISRRFSPYPRGR